MDVFFCRTCWGYFNNTETAEHQHDQPCMQEGCDEPRLSKEAYCEAHYIERWYDKRAEARQAEAKLNKENDG